MNLVTGTGPTSLFTATAAATVRPAERPVGWIDAMLQVVRDTPLDWATKVGIMNVIAGYVRHASRLAHGFAVSRRSSGLNQATVQRDYGRMLTQLVDPEHFPEAAKLFASGLFERRHHSPTTIRWRRTSCSASI